MSPHVTIACTRGTAAADMRRLVGEPTAADAIVDEIDDLVGKARLRALAAELRVPLVSAADVGCTVMLDVERYDLEPRCRPFHGRIGDVTADSLAEMPQPQLRDLLVRLVGLEGNSERMMESLAGIGGSIRTWPQLGTTATLAGAITATALTKILLGASVPTGRYTVNLDSILEADYRSLRRRARRAWMRRVLERSLRHGDAYAIR